MVSVKRMISMALLMLPIAATALAAKPASAEVVIFGPRATVVSDRPFYNVPHHDDDDFRHDDVRRVWVPAHWDYTPYGRIWITGHYDYMRR